MWVMTTKVPQNRPPVGQDLGNSTPSFVMVSSLCIGLKRGSLEKKKKGFENSQLKAVVDRMVWVSIL